MTTARVWRWTEADEDVLRDAWGCVTDATLAARLGRSVGAVVSRAQLLGLSRKGTFLTASAVGRICGVDAKTVAFWIGRGVLAGEKAPFVIGRYQPWRIEIAAFERFLHDHPGWYRWERITEQPWAGIVRAALAADPVFTVREAAAFVGCHYETIVRQCRSGFLPASRVQNSGNWGTWLIRRSALAGWQPRRPQHVPLASAAGRWGRSGPLRRRSTTPLAAVPVGIQRPQPAPVERQRVRHRPTAWRVS